MKNIYYQYDFYVLEQILIEEEFIKVLGKDKTIKKLTTHLFKDILNILFDKISRNEHLKLTSIYELADWAKINNCLDELLSDNKHYVNYPNKEILFSKTVEKFINRLFANDRYNDEKYIIEKYLHIWLEDSLAFHISRDNRFSSLKELLKLINQTELFHQFYRSLIKYLPEKWIDLNKNEWIEVDVNPEKVIYMMGVSRYSNFKEYENNLFLLDKQSLRKYVEESTKGSDYITLSQEYEFKSHVLVDKNIHYWMRLWDNLKFPITQDCVFHSIKDPQLYIDIIKTVINQKEIIKSDLDLLLYILINNFFDTSFRLSERLSIYTDEQRVTNKNCNHVEGGKKAYKKWQKDKSKIYTELFSLINGNIKQKEIENWVFSYKSINNGRKNNRENHYNKEIECLIEGYRDEFKNLLMININLDFLNLQKFNFYVDLVDKQNPEELEKLLNSFPKYMTKI